MNVAVSFSINLLLFLSWVFLKKYLTFSQKTFKKGSGGKSKAFDTAKYVFHCEISFTS